MDEIRSYMKQLQLVLLSPARMQVAELVYEDVYQYNHFWV